jgi:hypothetical protein
LASIGEYIFQKFSCSTIHARSGQTRFGQCHLTSNFLRFFKTFYAHALRNRLHGNTNFMIFEPTNQKLWMFENFRRSLDKAGMYWSQPAKIDHMCKNMWVGGRRIFLGGASLRHPHMVTWCNCWSQTNSSPQSVKLWLAPLFRQF